MQSWPFGRIDHGAREMASLKLVVPNEKRSAAGCPSGLGLALGLGGFPAASWRRLLGAALLGALLGALDAPLLLVWDGQNMTDGLHSAGLIQFIHFLHGRDHARFSVNGPCEEPDRLHCGPCT